MDPKKADLYIMLEEILERIKRIESTLDQKVIKISSGYPKSEASDLSFGESEDYSDNKFNALDEGYVTDDDTPIVMEESYDSDHDRPFEMPEVYPEPKLLLTPLQIQLANEEFMQYKGHPNDSE